MTTVRVLSAFLLFAAACGKSGPASYCDKYAAMEVKCSGHTGEAVRDMAKSFCESSQKDKDDNVMAAMIALEAECAQTETECDPYKACIEKKKDETTPPGM